MKFNKLSNDLNIKLIEGTNSTISYIKDYINNGENITIDPIDSSLKNKCIAYCPELSFGILSFSSYVDIEAMNIISSDVEINESKLLGVKSNKLANALKQFSIYLSIYLSINLSIYLCLYLYIYISILIYIYYIYSSKNNKNTH